METNDSSAQAFESEVLRQPRQPRRRGMTNTDDHPASGNNTYDTSTRSGEDDYSARRRRSRVESVRTDNLPTDSAMALTDAERNRARTLSSGRSDAKPQSRPEKKPNRPLKQGPSAWDSTVTFLTDTRWPLFFGIFLLVLFAYVTLCSISYFTAAPDDQSLIHSMTLKEVVNHSSEIKNYGGPFGAWLADMIYSRGFGIGSLVLVAYLLLTGLILVRLIRMDFWNLTVKSLIATIALSDVCALATYTRPSHLFWGGEHGYYLNTLLMDWSGIWGALCVAVMMVSALILIFFSQVKAFTQFVNKLIVKSRARRRERIERREAARHEREQEQYQPDNADDDASDEVAPATAATDDDEHAGSVVPPLEGIDSDVYEDSDPRAVADAPSEDDDNRIQSQRNPVTLTPVTDPVELLSDDTDDDSPVGEYNRPAVLADYPLQDMDDQLAERNSSDPVSNIVEARPIEEATVETELYDPTAELSRFRKPGLDLLEDRPVKAASADVEEVEHNKQRIISVLGSFGIGISSITATVGPTITLYEIVPAEGVRINKIRNLGDDIALSLSAEGIRIIAPMPGKGTVGIEVPNKDKQIVSIRSILGSAAYQKSKAQLPMAMGATISNDVYIADLADIPHLLVAGSTGTGKSVGLNTIITSILYKKHPAEVKFVLIDPKSVEFAIYSAIERHYLAKLPGEDEAIVTDMSKVVPTLNSLCVEMESRYELLKQAGVRHVLEYNDKFIEKRLNPAKGHRYMPYIVVVIDEFADLIMTAGKEVETPIARLAQKARAIGIHVILATQRPSANIITGVIRANFPGRIAFKVTQMLESRIILDQRGADQLVGRGDMLFSKGGKLERVQCAFISTEEVQQICDAISAQPGYQDSYLLPEYVPPTADGSSSGAGATLGERDPLFFEAGRAVIESGTGSTSFLQRRFELGYPRAGKIMDQLERAGVVGPAQGGKPRQLLMSAIDFELTFSEQQG